MIIPIERLEANELDVGIELDRICAWVTEDNEIRVCGELRTTAAAKVPFRIVISAHDGSGRVIGANPDYGTTMHPKSILQMTVFDEKCETNRPAMEAKRVRVYPQHGEE